MLGHLFRLPVEGGTAEQLTFGPYYDTDPVFSPDGTRVAFVSDRDGSSGNVFVLELATGQITQVTLSWGCGCSCGRDLNKKCLQVPGMRLWTLRRFPQLRLR